jgi:hypothetical protein
MVSGYILYAFIIFLIFSIFSAYFIILLTGYAHFLLAQNIKWRFLLSVESRSQNIAMHEVVTILHSN